MSSPPPTKPPRGVKQGKETSGLLMSVIRTLSASETNEQREKERAKLEKEYKKSDARLDELVAAHASEIMEVMQKFSTAGAALSAWGVRCDAAVARLGACRTLLQLRRSDLRRLWADARTQHYALQMLTDIERVVVSERETREAMSAGRVLAAATTLDTALTIAKSTLAHVDALHNTREHLENKKRSLVDMIVSGLSDAVYRGEPDPLSRRPSARRRTTLLLQELTKSSEVTHALLQDATPEMEASLSEEDRTFDTNVIIYLEALGVLDQLKEATERFKVQIQSELLSVICTVSADIVSGREAGESERDGGGGAAEAGASETGRPLATLLNCLADRFLRTANDNARLLQLWKAALQRHHIPESCLHTQQHYWSAVQQVLQLLLTEYLEIESVTLAAQRATGGGADSHEIPMADYFAKKRPQRPRTKLFRITAALPPGGPAAAGGAAAGARACAVRPLVCAPHPAHLHAALPALHRIATTIQSDTDVAECSLRAFITDYVRDGETERLAAAARAQIDAAMQEPSAWRERESVNHRLVFACAARAWAAVSAAAAASARLGACGGGAAARACVAALATLATHARHQHARLMPRQHERAAKWLADDDIVRFLQSLPNWKAAIATEPVTEDKQHDQELQQAYDREAEILSASLGDGVVTRREIVGEVAVLADMAVMCESMNWLSANIRALPAAMSSVKLSDKLLNDLESAALIFDEISHKCLLFLHLEMRIQCFHYLGQGQGAGSAEAGAGRLAHALLAAHEHAAQALKPRFKQYMMSGLGSMMSAGVMSCGAAGGAALATLRHCLAALQLPGRGLHHALAYTAALDERPEDIIQTIREKGAQFTELQYLNAFKIIAARRGITQADMKVYHKQLSSALGHIGVTV